ncbi:cytochrome C oxidase copper chaperone-domain-containing protein [Thamnocephalis sphaerospora]|uniref:Cytochrome C oxidase copper chaperone-domain-containing protein n=1 Tax=Thamnocephalis sphaerospora TaxID=78915 RepID=A0A4P9XYB4_9FUNG|nr:cytochrome C oxidase copper chaperone-domain-containing protein [Thamnocephalis sphaerospora]|eukprot:RKP11092.1 cytochrome C oxidase copper chaperone-domain-containing protein [Thamnocephalis sphaerospora]
MGQQESKPVLTPPTPTPAQATPAPPKLDPETGRPLGPDGKPLKPCCSCPETKRARDECMLRTGDEEACATLIEAHKQCLRDLGFKMVS